ncbi:chemotaxis protein CheW [Chitinimonas lacunae]|uniref:Chemotaxis protein CheA n=1 Tax=Chitinimonas lacunae TaxID=1963018 RepID=A0ABV8MUG7_9NEIS
MEKDLSQFHPLFFDEAEEHLANLEALLIGLDLAHPDTESLNAIFRAAHSIKGAAGIFGFLDISELTHILESLLDRVRKHTLTLNTGMVDLFLRARDVLGAMVAQHRDGAIADPLALSEVLTALLRLQQEHDTPAKPHEAQVRWEIRFDLRPQDEVGPLLDLLNQHGQLIGCHQDGNPHGERHLRTELLGPDNLRPLTEALAFLLPPSRTHLYRLPASAPVYQETPQWGLFDHLHPAAPAPAESEGSTYGFFEPLAQHAPAPPSPPPAPAIDQVADGTEPSGPEPAPRSRAESGTIRVDVNKVDLLLNLVGELVITQSMLAQSAGLLDPLVHNRLHGGIEQLQRNTRELQEAVMAIRMIPISSVFNRFPRVVRDLAAKLGKQVELRMLGEQTELDKSFVEKLVDPLTHLVRNSLDHGIESPMQRRAQGKPEQGLLTLCAFHRGGNVVIEVRDDGAGLSRERILAKARANGLPVSDTLPDQEVWQLIFEPGFSTAETVTDISGRGVGMDVVRRNIQAMGGDVGIASHQGIGTTMQIQLPLTLAILDGMLVAVGGETYILPLNSILESLQPNTSQTRSVAGRGRVVQVRAEYLPLLSLAEVVGTTARSSDPTTGIVVIIEAAGQRLALWVDELLGQQQVVVKNLEANYRRVVGLSGATILGDGRVALIIDVAALGRLRSATLSEPIAQVVAA